MNPEKKNDNTEIKSLLKHKATKVILGVAGVVALIALSGLIFKVITFAAANYNSMKSTIKR